MDYLDDLVEYSAAATIKIAALGREMRLLSESGAGKPSKEVRSKISKYSQWLAFANNTSLTRSVRLDFLTRLVNDIDLDPLPYTTVNPVYNTIVPGTTYTGIHNVLNGIQGNGYLHISAAERSLIYSALQAVSFGPILGSPDDNTALAAKFATKEDTISGSGNANQFWNGQKAFAQVLFSQLGSVPSDLAGYGILITDSLFDNKYIQLGSLLAGLSTLTGPQLTTSTTVIEALGSLQNQVNSKEPALGNPSVNGYVLSSTTAGVRSWIASPGSGIDNITINGANGITGSNVVTAGVADLTLGTNIVGMLVGDGTSILPATEMTDYLGITGAANGDTILFTGGVATWAPGLSNPMDNVGQLIYGGSAGVPTKLAANLVNAKRFLTETAIGGIGQAPVWSTVAGSDLSSVVPLALGGTATALVNPAANRIMGWDNATSSMAFMVMGAGLTYTAATKTISVDATGIVTSVSGTANRITSTGGTTPVIDISASYVGQSSITTLGTVGTGDWQAGVIDGEFGGTGLDVSALTIGNSIRVSASNEWEEYTPGTGSGTVTAVSIVSANGFAGSSSGGATPALTISTSISGILKGNGTAISAATVGSDYSVGTASLATGLLKSTTATGALSIGVAGTDFVGPGAITSSGLTMATARILGRTTASTGAIEELTGANVTAMLSLFATGATTQGLVPGSNSLGATYYLDGSGAWSVPAGGGGSGVTTVGTFSGSSQTNGASISGVTITFGPADGTNPGMVTTGTQTFAGVKTLTSPSITTSLVTGSTSFDLLNTTATTVNFAGAATTLAIGGAASSTITLGGGSASIIKIGGGATATELRFLEPSGSGTNYTAFKAQAQAGDVTYTLPAADGSNTNVLQTNGSGVLSWVAAGGGSGVTTMAAIGAVPNANGASISGVTLTLQPADASFGGVVTTGTQTLAGAKTFSSSMTLSAAGSTTTAQLVFSGSTNNWISYGTTGTGAPAFTTRSLGTKIVLYTALSGSAVDYSIGVVDASFGPFIATANTSSAISFYGGTTRIAYFQGSGDLVINNTTFTILTTTPSTAIRITTGSTGIITKNFINLGALTGSSLAAPATVSTNWAARSLGTRLIVQSSASSSDADAALGFNTASFWFSTQNSSTEFRWYGGATSIMSLGGDGVLTLAGALNLRAGTASAGTAPLVFTSGTNLTTPVNGTMEYNGTNLFFTRAGAVRENVLVAVDNATAPSTSVGVVITNFYGSSATNFLGDPNRWLSVNVLGTVYKIPLYS